MAAVLEETPRRTVLRPASAVGARQWQQRPGSAAAVKGQGQVRLPTEIWRSDTADLADQARSIVQYGPRPTSQRRKLHCAGTRTNVFTKLAENTADRIHGTITDNSYEDARKILIDIRKQYDDVHCEAERKEVELKELRSEIRLLDVGAEVQTGAAHCGLSRDDIADKMNDVSAEIASVAETQHVYQHMVERLRRELNIAKQKGNMMEAHLRRKTQDVAKQVDTNRRAHVEKVACINKLEAMEQEVELERSSCQAQLLDLKDSIARRQNEVRSREDFERWRYDVALEAANEAFQATVGQYRKIYAIEKLTGNCLQKITYEQAEQSQATEDGFQKIREVTGLTDVTDIVHKFVNRDVEHEQLRAVVHEAEMKLHGLREAEANMHSEGVSFDRPDGQTRPRGFNAEVAEQEQQLAKAQRDHAEYQRKLRRSTLLLHSIERWAERTTTSFRSFEELHAVEVPADLPTYFEAFVETIDRFLSHAHTEMSAQRLSKLACQASSKEKDMQEILLKDRDFMYMNCRVPLSPDARDGGEPRRRGGSKNSQPGKAKKGNEDDQHEQDFHAERERLKQEAQTRAEDNPEGRAGSQRPREGNRAHRDGGPHADEVGKHLGGIAHPQAISPHLSVRPASSRPASSRPASSRATPRPPSGARQVRPLLQPQGIR